jgi:hypothetical protein
MILAAWLALAPLRLLAALGLRRSLILTCLFVLAVTAYGVVEDVGLLDPPAAAKPTRRASPAPPSAAARADIPSGYLRLYRTAARRCPGLSWSVLAAVGKVESDHGRSPLPGGPLGLERRRGGRADAVRHRGRAGRQRLGPLRRRLRPQRPHQRL